MNVTYMSNPVLQMARLCYVICQSGPRLPERQTNVPSRPFYVWGRKTLRFIKKP